MRDRDWWQTTVFTQAEIARTAFVRVDVWSESPFGNSHPHRDRNEMCPYCKNEDTEVIRDTNFLNPFFSFYKGREFKVVTCWLCTSLWSIYKEKEM